MEDQLHRLDSAFKAIQSRDNDQRRAAERYLLDLPLKTSLVDFLIDYISSFNHFEQENRIQAAILLKNRVLDELDLRNENIRNQDRRITIEPSVVSRAKEKLLKVLFEIEATICKHLLPLVVGLAHDNFVENWTNLLQVVRAHLDLSNSPFNQKMAIEILRRVFKTYREKLETAQVALEVVTTVKSVGHKLYQLIEAKLHDIDIEMTKFIQRRDGFNEESLSNGCRIVANALDLIYSLNSIDLPQQFEDNMDKWTKLISRTLNIPSIKQLPERILEDLQSAQKKTLQFFNLYAQKYMEDFEPYVGQFFTEIWGRINDKDASLGETLVMPLMMSVQLLLRSSSFRDSFKTPERLQPLFQKLILPGLSLTEDDIDNFEQNPDDWISYDLFGNNDDTIRSQAMSLAKQVAKSFPDQTQALFNNLKEIIADPFLEAESVAASNSNQEAHDKISNGWKPFADFINLLLASIVQRSSIGIKVDYLFDIENVQQIYIFLLQDLKSIPLNFPILRATQLKIIYAMRQVPSLEWILGLFEILTGYLKSNHYVLASYASVCLETLLTLPAQQKATEFGSSVSEKLDFMVKENHILEHHTSLLDGLGTALSMEDAQPNLHALRSLYRVIRVAKHSAFPMLKQMPQFFASFLKDAHNSMSNPNFNYVLIETVTFIFKLLVQTAMENRPQSEEAQEIYKMFRTSFSPYIEQILHSDNHDLMGYIFEMESYLLAMGAPDTPIKGHDRFIHNMIHESSLWERHSSGSSLAVPSMIRYLIASMRATPQLFLYFDVSTKLIQNVQKAICSLRFDDSGFHLISQIIMTYHGSKQFDVGSFVQLTISLFERQSSDKRRLKIVPLKFSKGMARIMCQTLFSNNLEAFKDYWNDKQPGLFDMVMTRYGEFLPQLDTPLAKKVGIVSFSRILSELIKVYQIKSEHEMKSKLPVFQEIYRGLFKLIASYDNLDSNIALATDDMFVLEKYKALAYEGSRYQPIYCAQLADLDMTGVENEDQEFLKNLHEFAQILDHIGLNLGALAKVWLNESGLEPIYEKFVSDHQAESFLF